jgi:mycothiol synthase
MVTLMVRPYVGEADLEAIAHLLHACELVDQFDVFHSVSTLRQEFTEPGFDPVRDVRLWLDEADRLIGFAQMWIPLPTPESNEAEGYLWFRVHPQWRWQGLELEMMAWGERRIAEVGQERQLPARLRLACRETESDRIRFFEQSGLVNVRRFLKMERDLTEPIAIVPFPEGFVLGHAQGEADAQRRLELHNQSFRDHWNHHPATLEEWLHWDRDGDYRSELDLVAIVQGQGAADGTYAAYARCSIDLEENAARGCLEGWIGILGTRRDFRRRGLGRAMLLAGLVKLREAGMTVAKLGVDTENRNQAQGLYESVGFCKKVANLAYTKLV